MNVGRHRRIFRGLTVAVILAICHSPDVQLAATNRESGILPLGQSGADLELTQGNAYHPPFGFDAVSLGFKVRNNGPDEARDVVFRAALPDGTTFIELSVSELSEQSGEPQAVISCTTPAPGETGEVVCRVDRLPATSDPLYGVRFDFALKVTAPPESTLICEGSVAGSAFDPDQSNDTWVFELPVPLPPAIESIKGIRSTGKSYRIQVRGTNFSPDCQPFGVFVGEEYIPWHDIRIKNATTIVIRDQRVIRLYFPRGVPTKITIFNCEGGTGSAHFSR